MVSRQFLLEAIIISVLGALFGIITGGCGRQSFLHGVENRICGSLELGDLWNCYLYAGRVAGRFVSCLESRAPQPH